MAAAAAAAAVLGLRGDNEEEVASDIEEDPEDPAGWGDSDPESDEDNPPLDVEAIESIF
jgi:hypothetical protein